MPLAVTLDNTTFMLSETPFYHTSGPKGHPPFVMHPAKLTAHEYNSTQWHRALATNRDIRAAVQHELSSNFKPKTAGVVWVTHNVSSWVEYYYHTHPEGTISASTQCYDPPDTQFCREKCRYFEILTPTLVETSKKAMTIGQIQRFFEPAEWKQKVVLVLQNQASINSFVQLANDDPSFWWRFGGVHMTRLPTTANPMDESLIVPSGIISSSRLLETQRVLDFEEALERWEHRELHCTNNDEKLLPLLEEIREANGLAPLIASSSSSEENIKKDYKKRLNEYISMREEEGIGFFARSRSAKINAAKTLLACIDDPSKVTELTSKNKAMLAQGRLSDYATPILAWLQKQNSNAAMTTTPSSKKRA